MEDILFGKRISDSDVRIEKSSHELYSEERNKGSMEKYRGREVFDKQTNKPYCLVKLSEDQGRSLIGPSSQGRESVLVGFINQNEELQ